MDSRNTASTPRQIPSKSSAPPSSTASAHLPAQLADARFLAYKVGSLSRSNIHKEAAKGAPRLRRLLGHASIFDSAAKFILEHSDVKRANLATTEECEDDDDDEVEDEAEFDYDEDDEDDEDEETSFEHAETTEVCYEKPLETPRQVVLNHYAQLRSKPQGAVVITTTQLDNNDDDVGSDSGTEAGDDEELELSDDDWSDSTFEGDDFEEDDDHHHHHHDDSQRAAHAHAWKPTAETYSYYSVKSFDYQYPPYEPHSKSDDDMLLWSQQPRVLSQTQADSLLVEAFA